MLGEVSATLLQGWAWVVGLLLPLGLIVTPSGWRPEEALVALAILGGLVAAGRPGLRSAFHRMWQASAMALPPLLAAMLLVWRDGADALAWASLLLLLAWLVGGVLPGRRTPKASARPVACLPQASWRGDLPVRR